MAEKQDGCVKDQTVERMEKVVLGISIVEIIVSLGLLIYGSATYFGVDQELEAGEYNTNLKIEKNAFLGPLILITGLIGMIIGILGLFAAKKKGCFACLYVFGSLIVALICLIIGGIILSGDTAAQFREFVCGRAFNGKTGKQVAREQMLLTDTYMCSDTCPCPADAKTKYTDFYKKPEGKKRFEDAQRYIEPDTDAAAKEGFTKLVFASSGTTYSQYSKCYNEKLKKELENEKKEKMKKAYNEFKKDGLKYFQQLEKDYNCGGICEPSLFYVDLSITNGPPTTACISAITSEENYKNNYGVGAVAFITAIVLIFAAIAGIPLCRGFSKGGSNDMMSKEYA